MQRWTGDHWVLLPQWTDGRKDTSLQPRGSAGREPPFRRGGVKEAPEVADRHVWGLTAKPTGLFSSLTPGFLPSFTPAHLPAA